MRFGLTARTLGVGLVLAGLAVALLATLSASVDRLKAADRAATHSETVIALANELQRTVIDVETGERGYLVTGEPVFLAPYDAAVRRYPAIVRALEAVETDPAQERRLAEIVAGIDAYIRDWSRPVIALGRTNLAAARTRVTAGGGKRRIDALRAQFTAFDSAESHLLEDRRRHADRTANVLLDLRYTLIAALLAVLVGFAVYIQLRIVAPVRRLAASARRIGTGDLDVRAPLTGGAEIAELARDFNRMATAQQADRSALERLTAVNRTMIDSVRDGICLIDTDGRILAKNGSLDRMTIEISGSPHEEMFWDTGPRVAPQVRDPDEYLAALDRARSQPIDEHADEFELQSGRVVRRFVRPVRDEAGRLVGQVIVLRDVTAERHAEHVKEEFVSMITHELRSPLTSVIGYLELLTESGDSWDETQRGFLAIVEDNAHRLLGLVNDLLLVSRIESGALIQLNRSKVDLTDVVRRSMAAMRPRADAKQVELAEEMDGVPPVEGDRERLGQLLDNLLSNAVKFTPEGGQVRVSVTANGDELVLSVADTGIGIPADEQERLFERFFRSSNATAAHTAGTGLGLTIAKAISEAHGGRIAFESSPGGTTFRVYMPIA